MKHTLTVVAAVLVTFAVSVGAVDSRKAQYVGGTVKGLAEKSEGRFDTTNDERLVFTPEQKGSTPLHIPYASITELEYGQKAGRRVGVAIMVSPLALFSKKRNHFLTITYTDAENKEQAAVFELGKDIVRTAIKVVETRSGKDVQYQDDDARKALGGGKAT